MIVELLCGVTQLAVLAIIARVILSWFPIGPTSPFAPIARVIFQLTETMLGPVRRALPLAGPLDLSPIVVILFLQIVVQRLILGC
jgi:YggT family protein